MHHYFEYNCELINGLKFYKGFEFVNEFDNKKSKFNYVIKFDSFYATDPVSSVSLVK